MELEIIDHSSDPSYAFAHDMLSYPWRRSSEKQYSHARAYRLNISIEVFNRYAVPHGLNFTANVHRADDEEDPYMKALLEALVPLVPEGSVNAHNDSQFTITAGLTAQNDTRPMPPSRDVDEAVSSFLRSHGITHLVVIPNLPLKL